ncbi:HAD domain-containing protein [Burkholderia aenigmatica]|uniref:HAD domain-containing protein n=1 Tax=Burkholderia aenigmatica TaxID=2015348 RepID=UPI0015C66EC5|nr:HAD domain-containing protein [Burkholderia aenigmatica]
MRHVLFLDYDGVLHRGDSYITPEGVVSSAPDIELFEFARVLEELLDPYPQIEIVLSTDWCFRFGLEHARHALPLESLRQRVADATYDLEHDDPALWPTQTRGSQILRYARRHNLVLWLAIDDRRDGFHGYRDRLIHCQTEAGLGDPVVIEYFRSRLRERFSRSSPKEMLPDRPDVGTDDDSNSLG